MQKLVVAVGFRNVFQGGFALFVHQKGSVDLVDLIKRKNVTVHDGVPEHHFRLRIPALRPIFGNAFNKPKRKIVEVCSLVIAKNLGNKTVRKHVHQFVLNNVVKFRDRTIGRNHHAALHVFKKSSHAFWNKIWQHVRLFKMDVGAVKNKRYFSVDGLIKFVF